jgi:hypothetical protein
LLQLAKVKSAMVQPFPRHGEERSDEAIHGSQSSR